MPHREPLSPERFDTAADEASLHLFLRDFRRALLGGLAAAPLVAWVAQHYLPEALVWRWAGVCVGLLLLLRALLGWAQRQQMPAPQLRRWVAAALALDALAWGSMTWMLLGPAPAFDSWIGVMLAGVASLHALNMVREPALYRALLLQLAAVALSGLWLHTSDGAAERVLVASFYVALLASLQHPIARDLRRGMALRLANADLAQRLAQALEDAEAAALTDSLTGLPNRRALDAQLARQVAEGHRQPFSLLMLDIDHFKAVNDQHGHAAGDAVLQAFALRVLPLLRPLDLCARAGGEEFVVLLPGTEVEAARDVAERLRAAVAALPLVGEPRLAITLSIGVAPFRDGDSADALLGRADAAVDQAKNSGRDRVIVSP